MENIIKNENEEFEKLYQKISESIDDYKEVVSDKKENEENHYSKGWRCSC